MSVKRFVSYVGILCLLLQFSHASNVVADGGLTPWSTSDYLCASGGFGRDIELMNDGKIYTAGVSDSGFQMVVNRTLSNGNPDTTFGSAGTRVLSELGSAPLTFSLSKVEDLLMMGDGDVVAVGYGTRSSQQDIVIVRLDSSGNLDSSFDGDGVLILAPTVLDDYAYSGTVLSDGDIIIAGVTATSATNNDLYMARINSDGTLDNSFDSDGSVIINVSANDIFVDLAVRSDGNIAIAGSAVGDATVVVVTPTGAPYTAFNGDGVSIITHSEFITVNALSIQADGKMVFAGRETDGSVYSHLVGRLTANGDLDPTFDGDGLNIIEVGTPVYQGTLHEIVVQPDGKSAAIGSFFDPSSSSNTRTILFRLTSSGTLDTTLNSSTTPGYVASGLSGGDDEGYAIAVNSTGQLFTGLTSWTGGGRCVGISRYNTTLAPTTWTDESLSPALKNVAYSDTVSSNLGASAIYTLTTGTLPTGMALNANGTVSGTPSTSGQFPITITATTPAGTLEVSLTFTVNTPPSPSDSTISASAATGTAYADAILANGFPSPTYAVTSGALPTGLTLNTSTGSITGTPSIGGIFTFTFTVSNGIGSPISIGPKTITVLSAPTWSDSQVSDATMFVPYLDGLSATGHPAPTYLLSSGSLPAGINLNTQTGLLSGSSPRAAGTYSFVIQASNSSGSITKNVTITVAANNAFTAVTPARVADTRNNTGGVGTTKIGNGANGGNPLTFRVLGTGNIPLTGVAAVSLNVTAVGTQVGSEGGYITVYPCANGQPDVSNLNFVNDQTVPNAVIVPVDTNGNICAYVYGKAHIIIDVNGWFS